MLPTRHGILFLFVLLAMFLIAVNYNNSLAYLMTFTLFSTVQVSMLYTHRNLEGIRLTYGDCRAVFAGENLRYTLILEDRRQRDRFDIGIDIQGDQSRRSDLPASKTLNVECSCTVSKRGWYVLPPVQVNTHYPFGLLFSWSKPAQLERKCLVYPAPAEWQDFPARYANSNTKPVQSRNSNDDFSGLRQFRKGDSPQHIDWKTHARGRGLYSKEFHGGDMPLMMFSWDDTQGNKEHRISLLTRWILEAGRQGVRFGLLLPGLKIPPSNNEKQMKKCLKILALY